MNYKPRPGIVKVKLCGTPVLIPTREASAYCKTMQPLTTLWSVTWDAFCNGTTIEKSVPVHVMFTKKSQEECRARLEKFCNDMVKKGFFIEIPEDAQPQ